MIHTITLFVSLILIFNNTFWNEAKISNFKNQIFYVRRLHWIFFSMSNSKPYLLKVPNKFSWGDYAKHKRTVRTRSKIPIMHFNLTMIKNSLTHHVSNLPKKCHVNLCIYIYNYRIIFKVCLQQRRSIFSPQHFKTLQEINTRQGTGDAYAYEMFGAISVV